MRRDRSVSLPRFGRIVMASLALATDWSARAEVGSSALETDDDRGRDAISEAGRASSRLAGGDLVSSVMKPS